MQRNTDFEEMQSNIFKAFTPQQPEEYGMTLSELLKHRAEKRLADPTTARKLEEFTESKLNQLE